MIPAPTATQSAVRAASSCPLRRADSRAAIGPAVCARREPLVGPATRSGGIPSRAASSTGNSTKGPLVATRSSSRIVSPWSAAYFSTASCVHSRHCDAYPGCSRTVSTLRPAARPGSRGPGTLLPAHPAVEEARILGEGLEVEVCETGNRVVPAEEERAADRPESVAAGRARIHIARHSHTQVDGAGPQEAVQQVRRGQHTAGAVVDVERERAVPGHRRMAGVGADVLLDERRERGFGQVLVAVDADVDQQVELARGAPRLLQAVSGGPVGKAQRSISQRVLGAARRDGLNCRAHTGPRARGPWGRSQHRPRGPTRTTAA